MTTYTTVKDELAVYRRNRAIKAILLAVLAITIVTGLYFGVRTLFGKAGNANQTQTVIYVPTGETMQNTQTNTQSNTTDNTVQQPITEVKADYEVDDSMVAWGSSYSSVFMQNVEGICTGIDNKRYDYALIPNRQEVILDVSEINGYLKGTFALSQVNKSTSYFREIEIEIYDVGNNEPFFTSTMNSDTRSNINLCVKLAGHEKIIVAFGYAGGDVYLVTNGLYVSETR